MSSINISSLRHTSQSHSTLRDAEPSQHAERSAAGASEPLIDPLRALQIGDDQRQKTRESKFQRRTRPPRRRMALFVITLTVSGVALAGMAWMGLHPNVVPVQVMTVLPASPAAAGGLAAGGYVRHPRIVNVVSRVPGTVASLRVSEGDVVREGDVIATLDDQEMAQQLAETKAVVRAAQARVAELRAGGRREEIAAARARIDALRITAERFARDRARTKSLAETGVVSAQVDEGAENDSLVAHKNLEAAQQSLALLEAGPRPQAIAAAQAEVEAGKARVALAVDRLGRTEIRAPLSGRVLRKFVDVGSAVSFGLPYTEGYNTLGPGSPIVAIGQLEGLEATADINQSDLGRVAIGDVAEITADAFPDKSYKAKVTRFSPRADRNKNTVEVVVRFDDPVPLELAHDMSVKLSFSSGVPSKIGSKELLIPTSAITEHAGKKVVFVVENEHARARQVSVGAPLPSKQVPVITGIAAGEIIVSNTPERLSDGMRVAPNGAAQ